jgi:hypothetical protein
MDLLKLFVTRGEFAFPPDPGREWRATPEQPRALAELADFLAGLEGVAWGSALTPLEIVR